MERKETRRRAFCNLFDVSYNQLKSEFISEARPETMVEEINAFCDRHPHLADKLYKNHGRGSVLGAGTGPGEGLLYFVYDDIDVAGKLSTFDLLKDGVEFAEIKAVSPVKKSPGRYRDLKFGVDGNEAYIQFVTDLKRFISYCESFEHERMNEMILGNITEVNKSRFKLFDEIGDLNERSVNGFPVGGVDFRLMPDGTIRLNDVDLFNVNMSQDAGHEFRRLIKNSCEMLLVDGTCSSFSKIKQRYMDNLLDSPVGRKKFLFFDRITKRPIRFVEDMNTVDMWCECVTWNTMKLQIRL